MLTEERRRRIAQHLRARSALSVTELSQILGASEITLRRDLRAMAEEGRVVRTHGGAVLPAGLAHEPTYVEKMTQAALEKEAIARVAVDMIRPGTSVLLGPGTTTLALARLLVGLADLTVLTNSLLVAQALMEEPSGVEVIMTGGTLRRSIQALVGIPLEEGRNPMLVSKAFISGNGLTAERGLSTPSPVVAASDRALAGAAQQVVVLADNTKIGVEAMCQTVPVERIDILVTDSKADPAELKKLAETGIEICVADRSLP